MVEGVRNSALGGMWDPAYFNYGIAIHGALNVPLAAGVARLHPRAAGRSARSSTSTSTSATSVFVWDGVKEPEVYGDQTPRRRMTRRGYGTTTTSTTVRPDRARRPTTPATPAPHDPAAPTVRPSRRRRPSGADVSADAAADAGPDATAATTTTRRRQRRRTDVATGPAARPADVQPACQPAQALATSTMGVAARTSLEQALALVGGEQLEADLGVGSRYRRDRTGSACPPIVAVDRHADDAALVAPVETDRHPQHARRATARGAGRRPPGRRTAACDCFGSLLRW